VNSAQDCANRQRLGTLPILGTTRMVYQEAGTGQLSTRLHKLPKAGQELCWARDVAHIETAWSP